MSNCSSDQCEKVGAVACGEEITGVNPNKSDKTGVNLQKSINWSKPVKIQKTGVNLQKSIKPNTTKQTNQSNESSMSKERIYKGSESHAPEYNTNTMERLNLREEYDKSYNTNCTNKENVPTFEEFLELREQYHKVLNKNHESKDNKPTFDEWLNHIETHAGIISDSNADDKGNYINEKHNAGMNKGGQIEKKGNRKRKNLTAKTQKMKLKRESNKGIKQNGRTKALKLKQNSSNTVEDMLICENEDHTQHGPFDFTKYLKFDRLHILIANDEEWINDDLLYAFLNIIRIQSHQEVIVLHPLYEYVYTRPETNHFNDRLYQGDIDNFKVALIPVFLRTLIPFFWEAFSKKTAGILKLRMKTEKIYAVALWKFILISRDYMNKVISDWCSMRPGSPSVRLEKSSLTSESEEVSLQDFRESVM
ncbi:hypothetical protein DdX_11051 [Ditylenchus destructor]|uniref:Uncharacterized protein n=1 Tax=Ditylenchus destructor TaxID=166010 RepID=A0AAD4MZB6_9BILA|nr:hypothetical protein DdX_11051 [Ditylenchus destructor]